MGHAHKTYHAHKTSDECVTMVTSSVTMVTSSVTMVTSKNIMT